MEKRKWGKRVSIKGTKITRGVDCSKLPFLKNFLKSAARDHFARTLRSTDTRILSCQSTAKSDHAALLRLEGASKAESSSVACVSVSGSLLSLHLCTASPPLLLNHFWHALHCKAPLCSFTFLANTYASSCHGPKFYPCTPQSHSLPA